MIIIETASFKIHSQSELDTLYNLVIDGYERTESEIWGDNYVRIFRTDYNQLISKGEILLAKINGEVVGGIHCYKRDSKTFTFSLLATAKLHEKKGIGGKLIASVEQRAVEQGTKKLTIEILRAKGVDVKSKLELSDYYEKLGYKYTHSEDCSCKIDNEKYQKLIVPSDFDFYTKML